MIHTAICNTGCSPNAAMSLPEPPPPLPPPLDGGGGPATQAQILITDEYSARTNATTGDPLTARLMWNNLNQALATQLYWSKTDAVGTDITAALKAVTAGRIISMQRQQDSTMYAKYLVNSAADSGTYYTINVTYLEGAKLPFLNNYDLIIAVK